MLQKIFFSTSTNYNIITIQLITGQGYCSRELNYNMPKSKYFSKVQMLQKVPQLHNYNIVTIQLITGQGYCSKELNCNMPCLGTCPFVKYGIKGNGPGQSIFNRDN